MKFNKFDISVETLGNIELFSYDGYILGFRNWDGSDSIFFCPIVINSENVNVLDVYFDFAGMCSVYNGDGYIPNYNVYLKDDNKSYSHLNPGEVDDLIESISDYNLYIEPEYSFDLTDVIVDLMSEIVSLDKYFVSLSCVDDEYATEILFLDENNHIRIEIGSFDEYAFRFNSITGKMYDVVEIFKHFFEMLDKNLNKKVN